MADMLSILKQNLAEVEGRIGEACRRAGRERSEVTVVVVTKYAGLDAVHALHTLGVADLGESRPQELWRKAAVVPDARWHLVGHLQRNKIDKTLPLVQLIHSVDSVRLLQALEAEATKQDRIVDVLLEFNLSGEEAKHGFVAADVPLLQPAWEPLRHLRITGLMTMAALAADPEQARPTFAALRDLRDQLKNEFRAGKGLRHLSMGMTNDFDVAVEEGATLVRIGTALFSGLEGMAE